jgi:hypothetical protein
LAFRTADYTPTASAGAGLCEFFIPRDSDGLLFAWGGLWVVDVESGQRQPLPPE